MYVYFLSVYCNLILTGEVTESVTSDGTHQPIYIIDVESTAEVARSGLMSLRVGLMPVLCIRNF
jgi:hypothetical protein